MARHSLGRGALGSLVVLALAVLVAAPASGSPGLARIEPTPRVPHGASRIGAVPASAGISGTIVLKPRHNAALTRFISQVTDPGSPLFHRYLPAGAFANRFGPSRGAIDAVRAQLKSSGLRVTAVASDGLFVNFSGSARHVERAFHTGLARYRLANGSIGRAATSPVEVPSRIAGSVAAVLGLDDLVRLEPVGILRAPASGRGKIRRAATANFTHPPGSPKPCSAATNAARALGGLTDDQIANAYGAFGLYAPVTWAPGSTSRCTSSNRSFARM